MVHPGAGLHYVCHLRIRRFQNLGYSQKSVKTSKQSPILYHIVYTLYIERKKCSLCGRARSGGYRDRSSGNYFLFFFRQQ